MPRTGGAVRVGISGAPGVGKSTFIEAFGLFLLGLGRRP
ncbi:MAG: methylmalonyl Co-A mutase-associated GTPase MeaB, partial [Alphaproteobacteria bacterium]